MKDKFGNTIRTDSDKQSLARTVNASIGSSTEITFNTATKVIQVFALSKGIYLKWGVDDCATHTFDEYIPADESREFPIPLDSSGTPFTACNVLQQAATATLILIEK